MAIGKLLNCQGCATSKLDWSYEIIAYYSVPFDGKIGYCSQAVYMNRAKLASDSWVGGRLQGIGVQTLP